LLFKFILARVEEFLQSEIAVTVKIEVNVFDVFHGKHIHQLVICQLDEPFTTVIIHQIDNNLLCISPLLQPRKMFSRRLDLAPVNISTRKIKDMETGGWGERGKYSFLNRFREMKFGNETEIIAFSPKHRNRPPRLNMTIINILPFLIENKKLFRLTEIGNIPILINPPRKIPRAAPLAGAA
jgi:hypothetical protein